MSGYFPVELLIEILLRLPVKSLIRFTSVCKSWRSLISTPTFISSHLSNQKNQTLLLRGYNRDDKAEHYSLRKLTENGSFCVNSSSQLEFPFKSQIGYFRIVGSCDGLICLSDDFFANASQPIILWNPSVKNHVFLPKPIINPEGPHVFVLGFGVASEDYKVVRMVYRRKSDDFGFIVPPEVEIFSLKKGSWRKVRSVDVRLQILEFMWCQAFLNGVVHWLAHVSRRDNGFRSSILAFHVDDEVFGEIMLPEDLAQEVVTNLYITLVGDLLGVIRYEREIDEESCEVWVMKEYCVPDSWTRLYRIVLVENMEKVVAFCKNGEALVASRGHELVTYNPETRHIKDLGIYGTTRSFYIDNYVESLLLLRGQSRVDVEELNADTEEELMKVAFSSFGME